MADEVIVDPAALDDHASTMQSQASGVDTGGYSNALAAFLSAPNDIFGGDLVDHTGPVETMLDDIDHLGACCGRFAADVVAMDNARREGPAVHVEIDRDAFAAMLASWSNADMPAGGDWRWDEVPDRPWPSGGPTDDYFDGRVPAADPVDTFDGALWRVDDDVALWDPRPGVEVSVPGSRARHGIRLQRWFHSARDHRGLFGIGWASLLDAAVRIDGARAGLHTEDGSVLTFTRRDGGWHGEPGVRAELLATPGGWLATTGSGRLYEFDAHGNLVGLTDLHAPNLADLVDPELADPDPADSGATEPQVADDDPADDRQADGRRWLRHHVTIVRDGGGRPRSLAMFDGTVVHLTITDDLVVRLDGPTTTLHYGYEDGRLVTVTRPDRTGHYDWDVDGRLASVHRDSELLVRSRWDRLGQVVSQVDYDGGEWSFDYGPHNTTVVTRPDGATWRVSYDRDGAVEAMDVPEGMAEFRRDDRGRVIAMGGSEQWERTLDDDGGHLRRDDTDVVTLELGADGNTATVADDQGRRWLLAVDDSTASIRGVDADPGVDLTVRRDGDETRISSPVGTVQVVDDGHGRLAGIDGPDASTEVEWDGDTPSRVVQTAFNGLVTETTIDPFEFGDDQAADPDDDDEADDRANDAAEVDAEDAEASDADDTDVTDATDDATDTTGIDDLGDGLLTVRQSRGGHRLVTEVVGRDLAVHARMRGDGRRWTWQRDALGRVTTGTAPGGRSATWRHGLHGLAHRSGPDGDLAISWSPEGDIGEVAFPDGRRSTFEWDHGQVVASDTGVGQVRLIRDERGRVAALDGPDLAATWTRDERGWLVARHDEAGMVRWDHDRAGRVVRTSHDGLPEVGHVRDDAGRVVAMAIGDDLRVDMAGTRARAWRDLDGPGGVVRSQLEGATTRQVMPNGLVTTQHDDARGATASRQVRLDGQLLWDEVVDRDDGFQLQSMTTTLGGRRQRMSIHRDRRGWVTGADLSDNDATDNDGTGSDGTGSDGTGSDGDHADASLAYDHDDAGRRRGWTDAAGRHTVDLDEHGRVTTVHGPDGDRTLVHDAAGRVTADGQWEFTWNAAGGLVAATDGTTTVRHTLDAAGRRIRSVTTVDGQPITDRRWIWDLSARLPRIAAVFDHVSGRREVVRWGADGAPLAIIDPDDATRSRWLVTDHLGSVRAELDQDGQVTRRRTFGPFGEVLTDDASSTTNGADPTTNGADRTTDHRTTDDLLVLGFVGSIEDVETGHLHLHARQYDPTLGRFLAPDPIQAPIGTVPLDGHVYCANQPTELHDPTGAWPGFIEDAAEGLGDIVEGGADIAMDVAGAAKDAIDEHVPVVGDAIDWVGEHKTEIMTGLAVVGTVAAVAVTGGAAIGVLAPAWVGTVGTAATVTTGVLAAGSAVDHASEREWGPMAFDVAAVALSRVGVRSGQAADDVLAPFRANQQVLTRPTMRAALTSSDDVMNAFTGTFVEHFWYGWPLTGISYGMQPEPSPMP